MMEDRKDQIYRAFAQLIRYGIVGVMTTVVQTAVFYLCGSTVFKCLTADDWAVRILHLSCADFSGNEMWYESRWFLAALAISVGFVVADVFCWIMNRFFVFTAGKYRWYVEFGLFFATDFAAAVVAVAVQSVLIDLLLISTTVAMIFEIFVSFAVNYIIRKKVIFRG